jgi:uncharacterized protein YcsI (UPF0317 family)
VNASGGVAAFETGESRRVRAEIRAGRITGTSRGLALGFVQCNLVILPQAYLPEFLRYCELNARACPILEVGRRGDPVPHRLAPSADIRTDVARYAVWIDGVRQADRTEIVDLWRDDLTFVLIGSGITFDAALEQAGIRTDRYRWVLNTTQPTVPAGPFRGPLVVTMRWMTGQEADRAARLTSRYPDYHGGPIHIGEPAQIGADIHRPLFGGPVPQRPHEFVAVFWACGVTPQAAAEQAKLPLIIAHAPAHSFITDLPADMLLR